MINVNDARRIVLESLPLAPAERCLLGSSLGRILAEDIIAQQPVPAFDNSSMDGYAVRTSDLREEGARLSLQAELPAGGFLREPLRAGHAIRIMTGAPIPETADAVIEQELAGTKNGTIELRTAVAPGRNIRRKGEDIAAGSVVLKKGTRLRPAEAGVLASLGITGVPVRARLSVAVLTTGNELVSPESTAGPGQIRNSNGVVLEGLLKSAGYEVVQIPPSRDNLEELVQKLNQALESDAVVTSGGVSVGDHDYMLRALESLRVEIRFWKVNMKPGMPVAFGLTQVQGRSVPVFALPGNPVSSLVTFMQFVKPALEKMSGMEQPSIRLRLTAVLKERIRKEDGKRHFVRGICESNNGRLEVRTTGSQSSGVLTSLVKANCLIVLPEEMKNPSEGENVEVELL